MTKQVDLTTLTGWSSLSDGEHTITIKAKADGYRDSQASEGVSVTKGSTGETWVLNETPTTAITSTLPTTVINFTSNGTNFKAIGTISGAGPYAGNPIMYSETTTVSEESTRAWSGSLGVWVDTAYRTLTFQTAPTGDLLTWLQANGTKQGGAVIKEFEISRTGYHEAGTYQFEEGTTWTEWLASSYNSENWYLAGDGRIFQQSESEDDGWLTYAFLAVTATETIVENRKYYFGREIG